jgi:hypothetical protein
LQAQRFGHHSACRPQLRTVSVERMKVESDLAVIPVADWRGQFGMLIPSLLAGAHITLRVLDGRQTFRKASGDVPPIGHGQAIRPAEYSSASA